MQISNQQIEALVRESAEALRQGRPLEARRRLEQVTATGLAGVQVWHMLAIACRTLRDYLAEEEAVDRMLAIQPQGLWGLIMKGDCRARANDEPAAIRFYKAATRLAAGHQLPGDLAGEVRRAAAQAVELDARFSERFEAQMARRGLPAQSRSRRFQESVDILAGRKQIYTQEPTVYYFPELPQIQFYDPGQFAWAAAIEGATAAIRDELTAILAEGGKGFRPYMKGGEPRATEVNRKLIDNLDWSALFLCENGRVFDEVVARCPRTWEAVQAAPLPQIEGSAPTIMFSMLRGGAHIEPHKGVQNTRLICHLPLIVPPKCMFRVGNHEREWEEGKLIIFDDTIEHEARNDGSEDRVVLIFEIWRPELDEQERREVAAFLGPVRNP